MNWSKTLALVLALTLANCGAPPSFELQRLGAETSLDDAIKQKLVGGCQRDQQRTVCRLNRAALPLYVQQSSQVVFVGERLSRLLIQSSAADFSSVQDTLKTYYGAPCAQEDGIVDTGDSPAHGNTRQYWCFREGRLLAERFDHGARTDRSLVEFPSTPRPNPSTAPPAAITTGS